MKNITYLLGAGASANCMPVISNMQVRIRYLREFLETFSDKKLNPAAYLTMGFNKDYQSEYDQLQTELAWLLEESRPHQTVDTLAKKLYHTDNDSLLRLKRVLIFYFLLEQLFYFQTGDVNLKNTETFIPKQIPDKRYDSFIASILKNEANKVEIKPGIRVITWNYDMQFEMAFRNYRKNADAYIFNVQKQLQVIPSRRCLDDPTYFNMIDIDKFSIIKLNGLALFDNEDANNYRTVLDEAPINNRDRMNHFFTYCKQMFQNDWKEKNFVKMFNFCWEHNSSFTHTYTGIDKTLKLAKQVAEKTDILVVIGYSFPFFNRETDSILINSMKNLRKVYIQDLPANVDDLVSVFKSSFELLKGNVPVNVKPVPSTHSFFLPTEL